MSSQKILLVDDDASLRKLFGFVLRKNGFEVDEAVDGLDAIKRITDFPGYALIVLDVMMPLLDGVRVLSKIREDMNLETPVLVLTSMDRAAADSEIRAVGATDVAIKPLGHHDLMERVNKLLLGET